VLRFDGRELSEHADLSELASASCNDMVVDGRGNAYVGNAGFDMRAQPPDVRPAEIVLVRPDGSADVVDREVIFPNGSVVTPDNRTLVVASTFGEELRAFTIADDGALEDSRVFAPMPGRGPDGIALDAEGAVWVADARGSSCVRVREGGEIVETIDTGRGCFACALGGPERRTLFLMVGDGFTGPAIRSRTGAIEMVTVDVPGAGWP
jgi:sugar lactone lactonase YvrE